VVDCGAFFVICGDVRRHRLLTERAGEEYDAKLEAFLVAVIDATLFAQNACVAFEAMGYGICYIGGLRNKPDEVSEALALPHLVYPVFGLCIGHPAQNPEVKPRLPLAVVLKQDRYDEQSDLDHIRAYDAHVAQYYATRTGGQKDMTWSAQISGMLRKEARPHMQHFLQSRGFLLR
jgi:nitroreductase